MRVLFLVRSLDVGGAERQLVVLARGLRSRGHEVSVAVLYGGGAFEEDLRRDGIQVHDLAKRGRWDLAPVLRRLARLVGSERPHCLHAYMSLGNLLAATMRPLFPSLKVVWGVRSAMGDFRAYGWPSALSAWLERAASPLAHAVIANSEAARRQAAAMGMSRRKIMVIPNGIDCECFRFDPSGRERLREEWGIPAGAALVGMVARLDPVKNHPVFLRAAARVAAAREDVRFVCVGDGRPEYRRELERLAAEAGVGARLVWARGERVGREVYSALDAAVLSSDPGESFPNVVAEAMACGRPVVLTDSGDGPLVVGDTGAVVPPRDPEALARGIVEVLERARTPGDGLSARTRARIEREFSVERLVERTEAALASLHRGDQAISRRPGSRGRSAPSRLD